MTEMQDEIARYGFFVSLGRILSGVGIVIVIVCGIAFLISLPAILMALQESNTTALPKVLSFSGTMLRATFVGLFAAFIGQLASVLVQIEDHLACLRSRSS